MALLKLYRAVSDAELRDLQGCGRLRSTANSLEGKWFAESGADAQVWGLWFEGLTGVGHMHVIAVVFPPHVLDRLFRIEKLDGIGAARFATIEQLELIDEISLWANKQ